MRIHSLYPEVNQKLDDSAYQQFNRYINNKDYGFFEFTNRVDLIQEIKKLDFSNYSHFVHIGIGGSSLGAEALISALAPRKLKKFSFLKNIDPNYLAVQMEEIPFDNSVFFIVSKSGGTAETIALACIMEQEFNRRHPDKNFYDHAVVATDPQSGDLLNWARENKVPTLEIPTNVGGRFSLFSAVGLLPAHWAGLDIEEIVKGANSLKPQVKEVLEKSGSHIWENYKRGQNLTVFMPYSTLLRPVSDWFVQLWAESLGKKLNTQGEVVHRGLTPLSSYGATDQHSQVQLFMEGPHDKVTLFIEVEQDDHTFDICATESQAKLKSYQRLNGKTLNKLMKAELQGTLEAMTSYERSHQHIKISRIDEKELGRLFFFLECLTVYIGALLDINPFDQPGVELGKVNAYRLLDS